MLIVNLYKIIQQEQAFQSTIRVKRPSNRHLRKLSIVNRDPFVLIKLLKCLLRKMI